jgi:ribosome-binding factor A
VPQLHFVYDKSIERGVRLSQLIDEAVAREGSSNEPDES